MARTPGACLICGKPLQYFPREREMTCSLCGQTFPSRASCEDGHFVCDSCHARRGVEVILDYCRRSALRDPIRMAQEMMDDPFLYMHGNEHHILVGAARFTQLKIRAWKAGLYCRQSGKRFRFPGPGFPRRL